MSEEVRISKLEAQLETFQAKYADLQTKHTAAIATNDTLQAQVEGIPLVSGDSVLDKYPSTRLW